MADLIHLVLFTLLATVALAIIRLHDLFAAVMLAGVFSLLSAALFTVMDAVDVAFTEAAVGAGISTVLMIGALALTGSREHQQPTRLGPFVVVLLTGAMLIYGTLDMPAYGDPLAPIHHHLAPEYIAGATTEIGIPNIVTAVLASYRGFDTLGETAVIFTAGVGVMALLLGRRKRQDEVQPESSDEEHEGAEG